MERSEFLTKTQLFRGSSPQEIEAMLGCLAARERRYKAGARIHRMGDVIATAGVVLEGSVRIESVDRWGNVSVLGVKKVGEIFGEAYAAVPNEPLMVDVIAAEDTAVLFLNLAKMLTTCTHACPHHARVSASVTAIIARQSLNLSRRILHVAPKTIRSKVLAYLSDVAERTGENEFDIPFDRQQLADYLSVERSAMSKELCKMRDEGILSFDKNRFVLNDDFGQIG